MELWPGTPQERPAPRPTQQGFSRGASPQSPDARPPPPAMRRMQVSLSPATCRRLTPPSALPGFGRRCRLCCPSLRPESRVISAFRTPSSIGAGSEIEAGSHRAASSEGRMSQLPTAPCTVSSEGLSTARPPIRTRCPRGVRRRSRRTPPRRSGGTTPFRRTLIRRALSGPARPMPRRAAVLPALTWKGGIRWPLQEKA